MAEKNNRYNTAVIIVLIVGLGLGLFGYFGFMEFIKHFPMNG